MKDILSCSYADDNNVVERENFDDAGKIMETLSGFSRKTTGN